MDAFFLIDKPRGITSFQMLREMRKILGVKKLGHTGTLDPLATGLMLVATGNYTKLIPFFEKNKKSYDATIMLDGTSPSYDSDSEISYISHQEKKYFSQTLSLQQIQQLIEEKFIGKISQIPPKYSALKINGKRALDRTLSGEDITMKSRDIEVFEARIISFAYPELCVKFCVSAGSYIRALAHDIGQDLGTGGYLSALRRTAISHLHIDNSCTLEHLNSSKTLHPEILFGDSLCFFSQENVYQRLGNGQRVRGDFSFPEGREILLYDGKNIRFAVEYIHGVIHPRKKIV